MSSVSSRRFNLPLWLVGLFIAYSLMLVWSNYHAQQQIRASTLHEFNLQAEKRAAALTDFFATRRADLLELAELNELAGFFANRDLQMSMEYGLRINLLAIEAGFRRVMARKQTSGRAIYDSIILVDHAGQVLASAGTGLPANFDARGLLTRDRDQAETRLDAAAHRLVILAPVFYKDKPVGQIIAFANISLFERYYLQSNRLDAWNDVLVDAQGVPVFGLSPHLVDVKNAEPVIQQMKSGAILQLGPEIAFPGEGVLLVKWAIEGSPYHLLTLIPPDKLDQRLTPRIYLIAAGSVPLIVLFALLYFRHMQQINQELVNRYQESDRKRDELAGKFSALELEIQRREAVERELRRQGQELEDRSQELQSAIAAASHLARYDSLTGLSNRMMFREALQHAIQRAQRDNRRLAVLFLDLDHFKRINDSLGHSMGDRLLQEIAQRLVSCIRETDNIECAADDSNGWHVARQGGDEFTLLLNDLEQTFVIAHVASRIIEAMTEPLLVADHNLQMTCSIGISVYPDDGLDADSLLKNANTAMYSAKESGRNKYQFFEAAMQAGIMQRLELDTDLAQALDRGQLIVHYQPIAHAADCRIFACEALLRWHHPTKGWIPPSEFIPLAEESGQIIPITNFVLAHAAQQARHWLNSAGWTPRIAVNLSGRVLDLVDVPLMIASALRAGPANTAWLELELTESTLMQKYDSVRGILDSLRKLNVSISIDDFGTGYSSLAYLKVFPIDTLKIDRSFVIDLPHDSDSTAIVRAIIALAHSLNLEVIAEGVETEDQLVFLNAAGCEYVQGYLIGRPAAVEMLSIVAA